MYVWNAAQMWLKIEAALRKWQLQIQLIVYMKQNESGNKVFRIFLDLVMKNLMGPFFKIMLRR